MAENKKKCKSCGEMIDSASEYCLFCGAPQQNKKKNVEKDTVKTKTRSGPTVSGRPIHAPQQISKMPELEQAVASEQKIRQRDDEIKSLKKEKEQLEFTSLHDTALTGAANRAAYENRIASIANKDDCLFMMVDVNALKSTNDTYGHPAGDAIIRCVATALMAVFNGQPDEQEDENVYRIGGDEFAVILSAGREETIPLDMEEVERLLSENSIQLAKDYHLAANYKISISHGVACGSEGSTVDDVIKMADERMYQEKQEYKRMSGEPENRRTGIVGYDANYDGYYDDVEALEEDMEKKRVREGLGKTLALILAVILLSVVYEFLI